MVNDLEKVAKTEAEKASAEHPEASSAGARPEPATATASATERRIMRRTKTDLFVNRFLNGHPYLCRMTDISLSGARLVAINEPRISPPPSYMGLQFQLPGRREVITASGEAVTRADGHAVGVRFTRLPASAVAAIEGLLGAS